MTVQYKRREVEINVACSGDPCDAFIDSANYCDGAGERLTDDELDELQGLIDLYPYWLHDLLD